MQRQHSHSTARGRIGRSVVVFSTTVLLGLSVVPAFGQAEDPSNDRSRQDDGRRSRDRGERGGRFDRNDGDMRWMSGGMDQALRRGMRGVNLRQWLEPDFLRRDLVLFVDELGLDEDQGEIIEALLRDYEEGFEQATETMRERMESLRPQREEDEQRREQARALIDDMRAMRAEIEAARAQRGEGEQLDPDMEASVRAKMEATRDQLRDLRPAPLEGEELEQLHKSITDFASDWRTLRNGLKSQFMSSLYAMLAEGQVQHWPAFERKLRREKTLREGRLSGESVDLFIVLRDLDLSPEQREALDEVLDAYSHDLDAALAARSEHLEATRIESISAMLDQDFEAMTKATEAEAGLRRAVRDVNDRYAELIEILLAEAVSAETAETFGEEYVEQGYQRVFRPTVTQRSFEVAEGMEDLTEETRLAVIALQQAYEAELGGLNKRLLGTLRAHEPQQMLERIERMQRWIEERERRRREGSEENRERGSMRGAQSDDPIDEAFGDRRALDDRYRGHLESLLTPDQIEQLPAERRGRGNWGGQRGGERSEDDAGRAERMRRTLERFDTDRDGELSEAERAAARAARREAQNGNN